MEVKFSGRQITLKRVESSLDKFVISFCKILAKHNINYVIVSGYVAIVFGRSRHTEDVDILFEDCEQERFKKLFSDLKSSGFECIQAKDAKTAYSIYLTDDLAIRFYFGNPVPNMEFKFAKTAQEKDTLADRVSLHLNNNELFISQLEMQIPYKLYLGSEKDFEDARHLYLLLKDSLDMQKFERCANDLNIKRSLLSRLVSK